MSKKPFRNLDASTLPDEMDLADFMALTKGQLQTARAAVSRKGDKADYVRLLLDQIDAEHLPPPALEYQFAENRKWRFDLCWHDLKVALEVDGGSFGRTITCHQCGGVVKMKLQDGREVPVRLGGRHNSGVGFERDREKWAHAVILGWRVVGVTPNMVLDGRAMSYLRQLLL